MNKRFLKRFGWSILSLFILVNVFAFFHAWKFTHFTDTRAPKTDPHALSIAGKIKTICLGVDNPRPVNTSKPSVPYRTITLQSHEKIECWLIEKKAAKGTVAIFHGYSGMKSSMLDKADEFMDLGYNVLLVDFMGSGNSGGDATTIGFKEAKDVKAAYDYLVASGEKNICLFGTSMGAVAVLKAVYDDDIRPRALVLECPFGSLYRAASARFNAVGMPGFPLAGFLVFWGGVQHGFWGFAHRPVEYAKAVKIPTLLFYGEKDERVTRKEIDEIYQHLEGPKQLITFPQAGHANYLVAYRKAWRGSVARFLERY